MRIPPRLSPACRRSAGFTLIEIMAVIAVIIILAGILIGVTGSVMEKGDRTKTERMMKDIEKYLDDKRNELGRFPADLSGLPAEYSKNDVWNKPFNYILAENRLSYGLFSNGPDTAYGFVGVDDDADGTTDELEGELGLGDDISNQTRE